MTSEEAQSEPNSPSFGRATLVIPIKSSGEAPKLNARLFGGRQLSWARGPLGRLAPDESHTDYLLSHGLAVASYTESASPFPLKSLVMLRSHLELFDSPARLGAHEPGRGLHEVEREVWESVEIEALQFLPLASNAYWAVLGADLMVFHIRLPAAGITKAMRLLLRLSAPLAQAVVADAFDGTAAVHPGQRVGIGLGLSESDGTGGFVRDEAAAIWDTRLTGESTALLNGRLANVAVAVAVQYLTLTRLQEMMGKFEGSAERSSQIRT